VSEDLPSTRRAAGRARGILRLAQPDGSTEHQRVLPSPALAESIAHFWSVRWDLRSPFVAETLPHPSVHIVFESPGRAEIAGVSTSRFIRKLVGRGSVFGVKFRPAAFQPLYRRPLVQLSDRAIDSAQLFGDEAAPLAAAIHGAASMDAAIATAEAFFARKIDALPAPVVAMRDLVERLSEDRTVLRVEDVAALAGLDLRTLQRRFLRYVGVSPKWVIQRYRLHEAAEQLGSASPPSLAALAASLGYFDQPHFVRDFKAVVGRAPGAYARAEGTKRQRSRET
jgi:AraC-like DNA-binding protein